MSVATDPVPPTAKQAAILKYIYETARDRGYQPSFREVVKVFGFSGTHAVTCHLKRLERRGWIRLGACRSRRVEFLRTPSGALFTGFADKEATP